MRLPLAAASAAALLAGSPVSAQEAVHGLSAVETSAGVVAIPAGAARRLVDTPVQGGVSWDTAELSGLLSWGLGDPSMTGRAGLSPMADLVRRAFPDDVVEPTTWVEISGQLTAVIDIERADERVRTLAWFCPDSGQRISQTISGDPRAVDIGAEAIARISRCPEGIKLPTVFLDKRPPGWQTVRGTAGPERHYRREDNQATLVLSPAAPDTQGSCDERFQKVAGTLSAYGMTVDPVASEPLGEGCRWSGTLSGGGKTIHYRYELMPCPSTGGSPDWLSAMTRHVPDLPDSAFVDLRSAVGCTYEPGPGSGSAL